MTKEQMIATDLSSGSSNVRKELYKVIAKYQPSVKVLMKATNYILKGKLLIVIDSQDKEIAQACKKAWLMKESGKSEEDIFKAICNPSATVEINTRVVSTNYGSGYVVQLYSDGDLMRVQFEKNKLPIMCSRKKMKTVHKSKDKDNCRIWVD
jgi:hypothetical protein